LQRLIERSATLGECPVWTALQEHARQTSGLTLTNLLDEPERYERFSLQFDDVLLDFSRNLLTQETCDLLLELAEQRQLAAWTEQMFCGAEVNNTEGRPALHTALRRRGDEPLRLDGQDVMPVVTDELAKMLALAEALRDGRHTGFTGQRVTDVVNIGIGGSDLGLVMADTALARYRSPDCRTHYVSNIDGSRLSDLLETLDPGRTFFIICSKSFTTLETRLNADQARRWFVTELPVEAVGRHFAAVSVNGPAMDEFGIDPALRFKIWDWVGGR
jgi:glucose-6-phosphate isomerase